MLRVAEEAHKTDAGRQRQANEDSYFVRAPVFAVADGMGGAQAGEIAARIAAEAFEPGLGDGAPEEQLRAIATSANSQIHELAQRDASRAGMGTTLTAALVSEHEVSVAHVGDSRAYLFRDGELKRLTRDHSLVEELVRQGRLTDEEAEVHPQRSVITRALGPEAKVDVDTMTVASRDDDLFLLCSDGLTTMISDQRIAAALAESDGLQAGVERLIREANDEGGRDNITVVAFRIEDVEAGRGEGDTLSGAEGEKGGLDAAAVREAAEAPPDVTAIRPPADAELQARRSAEPNGKPPRTAGASSRGGRLLRTVLLLAIAAAIVVGAIYGLRQIYFIGADDHGVVSLYRGLPYELPLDVDLYQRSYGTAVAADALPPARRRRLLDHTLRSRADAVDIVRRLERQQGIRR